MAQKQTYEELEQRVKELEAEADRHRQVEKKLQESEARFRAFMDNNPAVAYIKNESGQHIYCNKTLFDKFDMSPDKFIGTTTKDFFPRAEAEKIEAYDEVVKTEGVPLETDDWSDKWHVYLMTDRLTASSYLEVPQQLSLLNPRKAPQDSPRQWLKRPSVG
jgi:transcriptional regulator with PAS, ATPase and Fis domain